MFRHPRYHTLRQAQRVALCTLEPCTAQDCAVLEVRANQPRAQTEFSPTGAA